MNDINTQINNLTSKQLRIAIDQENNEVLKELYRTLLRQQQLSLKHQKQIHELQNRIENITKITEKIVAKIEILYQCIKDN